MAKSVFRKAKTVNVPRVEFLVRSIKSTDTYKRELELFKVKSSNANYATGLKELFGDPDVRSKIVGIGFTSDVNKLFTGSLGIIGPIDRELIWSSCELFSYKAKLNEFVLLKNKYVSYFLKGDFVNAKQVLAMIEEKLGQSFWLIENKFALIGYTESHEELRKYEDQLVQASKDNLIFVGMIRNLAHKSTVESSNILLGKFTNSLIRTVEELGHKQAIDYFKFKLDHYNYKGTGYSSIIVWERLMPIVDRYETFVKVCQRICLDGEKNVLKYVAKAINTLSDKVHDHRLRNMRLSFNDDNLLPDCAEAYEAIECYTTGDFKTSTKLLGTAIESNPDIFNLWEMLAKSKVQSGDVNKIGEAPSSYIIDWMMDVLTLNDRFSESSENLTNISRMFSSLDFSTALNEFLYKNSKYCDDKTKTFYIKITDLNSIVLTPRFAFGTKNESLMMRMGNACPISSGLMKMIYNGEHNSLKNSSLPAVRKNKSLATLFMVKSNYNEALKLCYWLLNENIAIYKVMVLRNIIKCLYKTEDFTRCINVLVDAILIMPSLIYALPVNMVLDGIENGKITNNDDNLKSLILYDCYSKSISSAKNDKIADMFDRFVDINGYESPVDIIKQDKYDKNEVRYFLKNICITENLDVLDMYAKSDEVYTERLKICETLRIFDPPNRAEYDFMIDEIITKMIVESAMSRVDGGRIYIDIDGLKRTVSTSFAKSFNTLKLEFPAGAPLGGDESFTSTDRGFQDQRTVTPQSSFGRRLFSLYKELYKEFKENTEYGLDCSLGTDIRHGHLSNQIRPILDRYKLIFQKGSDGKYTSNKYWYDKYSVVSTGMAKDVDLAIIEVSSGIDRLIDDMRMDWFNISGKNFPLVTLSEDQFVGVQRQFHSASNSEEFLNFLLMTILETSDTALSSFRKEFGSFYASRINKIFVSVFNIIESRFDALAGLIEELLVCKNELLESGDEISNWIGFSSVLDPPNFNISVPVGHSIDVFKKLYMHSNIQYFSTMECDVEFNGKHLRSFVRIFIILIENAIKHSGLSSFQLYLAAQYRNGLLTLTSSNVLSKHINLEVLRSAINNVLENIHNKHFLDESKNDKRSGIYKIARILHSNLSCENSIDINIDDGKFMISIVIDCKEIIA